jgi:hypothetical protein
MKMKISKGGTENKKPKKTIMSLCKNEKNKKGGRTEKNPSYPCMKIKISKEGTENEKKTSCPYAKIKKIKKRDGLKKHHPIPV